MGVLSFTQHRCLRYGCLASLQMAGAALLFMSQFIIPALGLPHSLEYAISFDPFSHVGGLIIIVIAVLVSVC